MGANQESVNGERTQCNLAVPAGNSVQGVARSFRQGSVFRAVPRARAVAFLYDAPHGSTDTFDKPWGNTQIERRSVRAAIDVGSYFFGLYSTNKSGNCCFNAPILGRSQTSI